MSNEKETKVSALDAKAKALANEEDEDTKIAKLLKNMPKWRFYSLAVLTVIWTVFQLYIKLVKPLDPWFQLPLHMCLALVVVWLYNPMVEKSKSHNKLWYLRHLPHRVQLLYLLVLPEPRRAAQLPHLQC